MSEDRLANAVAAATPPRDPAFTLAVLRAAENARYHRDRLRRVLISGGLAADAALILAVVCYAAQPNASNMLIGVGGVALCAALLLTTRSARRLLTGR